MAIAARLPSFPIEGSAGSASGTVAGLFSSENGLWSITGAVAQTVFDAGALRHKQAAAYAALDQAKAQYRSAVLGGLQNTADALQVKLRISAMPAWMLGPSAMFSPFLRELKEMRFQWDRPYQVDASRFKAAFWSDVTPFETGVPETALAFRAGLKRKS